MEDGLPVSTCLAGSKSGWIETAAEMDGWAKQTRRAGGVGE